MLNWKSVVASISLFSAVAFAQSEAALRTYFEGRQVVVKMDMPATKYGVDVNGFGGDINYSEYAKRLKRYGTSIRKGDSTLVTRVKVKERLIEFQLGGGGYGTLGDETDSGGTYVSTGKTQREKNLERDLKNENDEKKRREMKSQLDDLRRDRQREEALLHAAAEQAEELRKANIQRKAVEGGSRFNIVFPSGTATANTTPEAVMAALSRVLEFPEAEFRPATDAKKDASHAPASVTSVRKGMTSATVHGLLGTPASSQKRKEGSLQMTVETFNANDGTVEVSFVEDVVVMYSVR